MMKYTEFGQKRLPVITSYLTVKCNMKLKICHVKKGIWKGTQIMFYKAVNWLELVDFVSCE
jgi:hypothetical protein